MRNAQSLAISRLSPIRPIGVRLAKDDRRMFCLISFLQYIKLRKQKKVILSFGDLMKKILSKNIFVEDKEMTAELTFLHSTKKERLKEIYFYYNTSL